MEGSRIFTQRVNWRSFNLAALAFSIIHILGDFGLLMGMSTPTPSTGARQALLATLLALLYTWWVLMYTRAISENPAGLAGLTAFSILWVSIGNGMTIIFCMPPCGNVPLFADMIHIGNLILGLVAAFMNLSAMRGMRKQGGWLAIMGNVVIMVAFLVSIFALEASLINK